MKNTECPICGNKIGFAFGTCIKCGYNHIKQKYDWIKVDVNLLAQIVPEHIFYALIMTHEDKYKQ